MRNKTKLSSVNSKILTFPSTQYYSTNKLLFPLCKHFFLDWRQQTKNTHTADQQASVWLLLCIMTVGVSGVCVFIWTYTILLGGMWGEGVCTHFEPFWPQLATQLNPELRNEGVIRPPAIHHIQRVWSHVVPRSLRPLSDPTADSWVAARPASP